MKTIKRISALIVTITLMLTVIIIPTSAATSGNYTYIVSDGKVTITDFKSSVSGSVSIPSKIAGKTVVAIGDYAFADCYKLTSVTVPKTVKTIGKNAFAYCYKITKITLNSGLVTIGEDAFRGDFALKSITIPSTVKTIGEDAFYYCEKLPSINIPASVTSIGAYAFEKCTKMTKFSVSSGNPNYSASSGVLFNKNKTELLVYPDGKTGSYTIPSTVTSIADSAFSNSKLSGVTIPKSVNNIDYYAFANCDLLTKIAFPSSLKTIPTSVCSGCAKLSSITIPSSVVTIEAWAFESCPALTSITIPSSVTQIGGYYSNPYTVFYGDKKLASIKMSAPNNSYSAQNGVLFNKNATILYVCPMGKSGSYTVPSTVTEINSNGFLGCSKLTKITLPASLLTIGSSAFASCDALTSITIPENVVQLYTNAFYAKKLAKINVSEENQVFASTGGVLFNKDKTTLLIYPTGRTGPYTVPTGTTTISKYAFMYNTALTRIYFPNTLTTIEEYAFGSPGYKEKLVHYYYNGSTSAWKSKVTVSKDGNKRLTDAKFHSNAIRSATPKLGSTKNVKTGIYFSWKKYSGAEGYYVYRKTGSGSWKKIATVKGSTKVSYIDKTAKKGKTYKYTVKAYHGDYISKYNTKGLSRKRS